MARAGTPYPQVEPGAMGLCRPVVAAASPRLDAKRALALAERASAEVLWLGRGAVAERAALERARAWGLGRLPVGLLARRRVPAVPATTPEIAVRRLLHAGAPMVVVRERGRLLGVVRGDEVPRGRPGLALTRQLLRVSLRGDDAQLWVLKLAGKVGEGMGVPVFAVGGFVRDLLLDRRAPDLDLVAEGDGIALARRLHEEIGGRLTVHEAFATASIEGGRAPGGASLGRVDVASARRERYARPGALPEVAPAPLAADLERRDFGANAMALALAPSGFGRLADPQGGWADVAARRLRPLNPLSFVEDPTRVFRAARYAARLGFRLDPAARDALALLSAAGPCPALSGDRLRAELELIAGEADPWAALRMLARWGAFAMWDAGYRPSRRLGRRLARARALAAWARRAGVALEPVTVALVALLGDQRAVVRARCLDRLGVAGAARRALQAMDRGRATAALVKRTARRSRLVRRLAPAPAAALVAAWLEGDRAVQRRLRWFWTAGRALRPHLTGDDLVALGVPRGPAIGALLGTLRDGRLDGALRSAAEERDVVHAWLAAKGGRS